VGKVARSAGLVSHERGSNRPLVFSDFLWLGQVPRHRRLERCNSDVTPPAGVVSGYVIARKSANREVGFSTQSEIL